MEEMIQILMRRDGLTREEVQKMIDDFSNELLEGNFNDPEEHFMDTFGLEPDYLIDILF